MKDTQLAESGTSVQELRRGQFDACCSCHERKSTRHVRRPWRPSSSFARNQGQIDRRLWIIHDRRFQSDATLPGFAFALTGSRRHCPLYRVLIGPAACARLIRCIIFRKVSRSFDGQQTSAVAIVMIMVMIMVVVVVVVERAPSR
jgi:hypothetical protein